ncbi:MAG: hypothetical protein EOO63_16405 [Hymenobacter sp.]|nr:MAG: hypothetical protein EOO63_16405 [Hymenobacter sp.]
MAAYRWQRVGVLAGSSLALSLALVLYLFGIGDHFLSRLFSAFFVWFWLLAVTFSSTAEAQTITINVDQATLRSLMDKIEVQSGYDFVQDAVCCSALRT